MLGIFKRREGQSTPATNPSSSGDIDVGGGTVVRSVSLAGDPEKRAAELVGDVPGGRLDTYRVKTDTDLANVFKALIMRQGFASIERDEIIGFVEKNGAYANQLVTMLEELASAGEKIEDGEKLSRYFSYLAEHIGYACRRQYDKIDVRSDKLFWLIYVLSSQLGSGMLAYDEVLTVLSRPHNRARISSHQLIYMLKDFAEAYGEPNQPSPDMLAIIAIAARPADKPTEASAALSICLKVGGLKNGPESLRILEDVYRYLVSAGAAKREDRARLDQLAGRYGALRDRRDF
jgi:hypothetical protein